MNTNSAGATRFFTSLNPTSYPGVLATNLNTLKHSLTASLNAFFGGSVCCNHTSSLCAVGNLCSGSPSQQNTICAMAWKSRPREVSSSMWFVRPVSLLMKEEVRWEMYWAQGEECAWSFSAAVRGIPSWTRWKMSRSRPSGRPLYSTRGARV